MWAVWFKDGFTDTWHRWGQKIDQDAAEMEGLRVRLRYGASVVRVLPEGEHPEGSTSR